MYTPEQVEQMIFQHCNERLNLSPSLFNDYKAWTSRSLYFLSGMDSIDVLEFNMFTEQAFGVTMSEDELYHLSLESIINKCVSLQKPKPAPTPQVEQVKPKSEEAKPQSVATKPQAEQAKPQTVAPTPQAEQAKPQAEQTKSKPAPKPKVGQTKSKPTPKPKSEQAKPKPATKPKSEQAKPQPVAPTPQAEQAKPQTVAPKPVEQPQVETKTMAGMMVCKLLGDVCNRRPTGKPNYDAQNWCEFVDCVLFKNFQKLR